MISFMEKVTAVGIIAIGVFFGAVVLLTVGHTVAQLIWMWKHSEALPARATDLVAIGRYGRGNTTYRLEVEFEWQGETRRIRTQSGYQFGVLFEKRRAKRKLEAWQAREVEILYSPEMPKWLAVKGSREVAYVKGLIWKDALFAGAVLAACAYIALQLI